MASGADTLLLDRDGVINRWLPGDYVTGWDQFAFLPGVLECLRLWAGRFRHIFIVSNQRGVGKGKMTQEQLDAVHARMTEEVVAAGGRIDGIYVCTAISDENPRRKPNPGMFGEIRSAFPDVVPERTVMLGDSRYDREFAENCGISFILMETAGITLRFQAAASSDS
ncbi:MAG: HAD-IIIA family hydrolase [Bacteroidales bacterium]|nr:HAD-IIIA family hydrolase [Bacteroidales bacterium]